MREKTLGSYLRAKRVAAGLSLRNVAEALGVSHVYLSEVERNVRGTMRPDRLKRLEEIIPGFAVEEVERVMTNSRPVQLTLTEAPAEYQNLGLALARRIERQDLKPVEMAELQRILSGGLDEDE